MTSQTPLWTRSFIFICLAHVCMTIAFYANMPVLPLFLKDRLGAEGLLMGLVIASYTATAILSRPVAGFWLDRVGRMILYVPSYLLFGLLFFAYPLAGTIAAVALLRLTHGVLWGAMMGAANTLAVDLIPPGRRGEGIGMFGLTMNLGLAIGPAIGLPVAERFGYDGLFIFGGLLVTAGFILVLKVRAPAVPLEKKPFAFRDLLEKTSLPVSLVTVIICLPFGVMMNYTALYTQTEVKAASGTFFLILALGMAVSRIMAGKTFDRQGPGVAMFRAFVFLVGALALQAFTRHGGVFYLSAVFLGFGYGISAPVCQAMVNALAGPERRGAANATFMTAFDLGISIGIVLIGHVQKEFGWGVSHGIEIGCFLLGAVLFWTVCLPHYNRTLKSLREKELLEEGNHKGLAP